MQSTISDPPETYFVLLQKYEGKRALSKGRWISERIIPGRGRIA
jgi:hypothetical protein